MLTDDGSRTLRDGRLNETYHSGCGALSECLYVYLRNSGIEARIKETVEEPIQKPVKRANSTAGRRDAPLRVLEIGFGTGMAWLLTAASALAHSCALEYVSVEHDLLPADVLRQLDIAQGIASAITRGDLLPEVAVAREIEQSWLAFRSGLPRRLSQTTVDWSVAAGNTLRLVMGDAREFLNNIEPQPNASFHAIYFDAFSPASNPELWQTELFQSLTRLLTPNGRLVSYCVSGAVRRALESAGFVVQRLAGPPGGKREVLVAHLRPVNV